MIFASRPIDQAQGAVLAHNVVGPDGRRVLRKGQVLTAESVEALRELGRASVYVAELEEGDVSEDEAAQTVSKLTCDGAHLVASGPRTGRLNLRAAEIVLVEVDQERLLELNLLRGVTLATQRHHAVAHPGRVVATTKILPYAIPGGTLNQVRAISKGGPILRVVPVPARRVGLVVGASSAGLEATTRSFKQSLGGRLEALGSTLDWVESVVTDTRSADDAEIALANAIETLCEAACELVILAGETAVQDEADQAPRALLRSGGVVECFGAPVDPGNLLLLGYRGEVPVLGAPGCARSPKSNIVDLILPRLLVGHRVTRRDIAVLGAGGLLEDVPERPLPRSQV